MGLFTGDGPSRTIVGLDPTTNKLINTQINQATDPNLSQTLQSGAAQSGQNMLQTDTGATQEAAGMGQNPAMMQAIRNQYNNVAGKHINQLMQQSNNTSEITRAAMLQRAQASAHASAQVQISNYERMVDAMNNAEMARAQTISGILGLGGMAAGMAMGRGRRQGRAMSMDEFNSLDRPQGNMSDQSTDSMMNMEGAPNTGMIG